MFWIKNVVFLKTAALGSKKLLFFFLIGFALLSFVSCQFLFPSLIEKYKSPVVFYGCCEHTMTSVAIILRKDKSFEYNLGSFMKNDILYGKYEICNDTILLFFKDKQNCKIGSKMVSSKNGLIEIGDSLNHRHNFKKITLTK